jgi:hypothetical protein
LDSRKTAAPLYLWKTNVIERWITNHVEVRMPTNVFVNEYRTNWFEQWATNVVNVYRTNWNTASVTNTLPVERVRTNFVTAYRTNLLTKTLTNSVPVTLVQTNFVDAFRTNFLTQQQTNWKTLNLTNWENVLIMKTNWVTQLVTNVVEIDLPANRPLAREATSKPADTPALVSSPVASSASPLEPAGALLLDAARTSRPVTNNYAEVRLTARWKNAAAAPLEVPQWRVEREDGAILAFGQEPAFVRELPIGRYKVQLRAQREGNNAVETARGVLDLTAATATMQQKAVPIASIVR